MIKEIDLFGVFLPPMFAYACAAALIWAALRRGLAWVGFDRLAWHSALFSTALYAFVLSCLVILFFR